MSEPLWTVDAMAAAMRAERAGTLPAAIPGLSIDTRTLQGGEAFFAIKGDRDGHDFVTAAIDKGAGLAVVSREKRGAMPKDGRYLVVPDVLEALQHEAPGIELSVVPSARRGNAWLLESGEVELALGAAVDDAPGIRSVELCTEKFVCAVRRQHPEIRDRLTLGQYTRVAHLVISLGDDEQPEFKISDDLKLFVTSFAVGFVFVSALIF